MVNGSSQQKKMIYYFHLQFFIPFFSNALQFEVNNLSPGVEP